jgi:hypothetical protein
LSGKADTPPNNRLQPTLASDILIITFMVSPILPVARRLRAAEAER